MRKGLIWLKWFPHNLTINVLHWDLNHEPLFHDEFDDFDVLGLSKTVDPVEALLLRRRVPGRVEQVQVAGSGQVEADAT